MKKEITLVNPANPTMPIIIARTGLVAAVTKRDISEDNMVAAEKKDLATMAKVQRMSESIETLSVSMDKDAKIELFKIILCSVPKQARSRVYDDIQKYNPDTKAEMEQFFKHDMKVQCSGYKLKQVGGSQSGGSQSGGQSTLKMRSATFHFFNGPNNVNNLKGVIQAVKDGHIGSTAKAVKISALNPDNFDNDKLKIENDISDLMVPSTISPTISPATLGSSGGSRIRKRSLKKRKYMKNRKSRRN